MSNTLLRTAWTRGGSAARSARGRAPPGSPWHSATPATGSGIRAKFKLNTHTQELGVDTGVRFTVTKPAVSLDGHGIETVAPTLLARPHSRAPPDVRSGLQRMAASLEARDGRGGGGVDRSRPNVRGIRECDWLTSTARDLPHVCRSLSVGACVEFRARAERVIEVNTLSERFTEVRERPV